MPILDLSGLYYTVLALIVGLIALVVGLSAALLGLVWWGCVMLALTASSVGAWLISKVKL